MNTRRIASLLFVVSTCSWGQGSTARINGTIHDSSGLGVPGADVEVVQADTGLTRSIASQTDGSYVLSSLPVGPYQIEVIKEGFAKYLQGGIVLQVDGNP